MDYFMHPFTVPGEKEAIIAIAQVANREESDEPITTNPQDFELWQIATVDDQGEVTPAKKLLAKAIDLVRRGIRQGRTDQLRAPEGDQATGRRYAAPSNHRDDPRAETGLTPYPAPGPSEQAENARTAAKGIPSSNR